MSQEYHLFYLHLKNKPYLKSVPFCLFHFYHASFLYSNYNPIVVCFIMLSLTVTFSLPTVTFSLPYFISRVMLFYKEICLLAFLLKIMGLQFSLSWTQEIFHFPLDCTVRETTELKGREQYKLCTHKFDNSDEISRFFENHKLPKITQ